MKKELKFDQRLYAQTITERFGIDKIVTVPATACGKPLSKEQGLETKIPYREAVGEPMWISTTTRPDISRTVHTVAKFCENPGMVHRTAVVKTLQYMRRTPEREITYDGDGNGRTVMRAFVDSDHATCLDTGQSTSGGAKLLSGGAISRISRAEVNTVEIISDAEYVVVSEIAEEVIFIRQVPAFSMPSLESKPVDMVENNQEAIKMANKRHSSKREGHIYVKHHLIRDAVDEATVCVTYVKTEDSRADVLTKPLYNIFEST